jgi:hypothetical protein
VLVLRKSVPDPKRDTADAHVAHASFRLSQIADRWAKQQAAIALSMGSSFLMRRFC